MKAIFRAALLFCAVAAVLGLSGVPSKAAKFPTKLFLSQDGIAFSQFPSRQVLTKTIRVDRTQGHGSAGWTATSDQTWLTATPSGATGGKLTVKASAAGLAADQFYSANVTVSTDHADFTDSETLHVGLWVGSADPGELILDQVGVDAATNPVTPIVYLVTADGTSIRAHNVYTGALMSTFQNVAPYLGHMEVSSDGATLFAVDTKTSKIVTMDANSGTVSRSYLLGYPSDSWGFSFAYARPYGQPALYIPGDGDGDVGRIMAYPSGVTLAAGNFDNFLTATPDGRFMYTTTTDMFPSFVSGYSLRLKGGSFSLVKLFTQLLEGENCPDIAVSHDGKHLYSACGSLSVFDAQDGSTGEQVQSLPAAAYPANIEIDSNDHVWGGVNNAYEKHDVYVYNQKGFPLKRLRGSGGSWRGAMKISGDATRVVDMSGGSAVIRSLP